jgi:6-pyruvoyltetrahydropterin/6-carboxytetrahydropterin synthase
MSWTLKVKDKFQAAHFLKDYKGKCEKIHGHTFHVEVSVVTSQLNHTGISLDFTQLKDQLAAILPDHTLLNDVYDFPPSAENLARHFYYELRKTLPVKEVTVWESEDASATYSED